MKISDAFWEKRNLGVTCYELQLELADKPEAVAKELDDLEERQYMVARIPSSCCGLVQLFQNRGYSFAEAAIMLENDLRKFHSKKFEIPPKLQKICGRCSWRAMNETELLQLSEEIHKNIFQTDRVYLDPEFTSEQAAQRYEYWTRDLMRQGAVPYKVVMNGEIVGFFLNREIEPHVFDGLLAAAYREYAGSGMGYCIQYAGIMHALEQGGIRYLGHVSGNNPAVLKILLSIGFSIKKLEYVFVKHNS